MIAVPVYFRILLSALILCGCASACFSQYIQVQSENGILVSEGRPPNRYNGTIFSSQKVGSGTQTIRYLISDSADYGPKLQLSLPITISGPGAGSFTIEQPPYEPHPFVTEFEPVYFPLTFAPSAEGISTATVTIQSNSPDSAAEFTFLISGNGITSEQLPEPDLVVEFTGKRRIKYLSESDTRIEKRTVSISNLGPLPVENATLWLYHTPRSVLDLWSAQHAGMVTIDALPAYDPRKKLKSKKVKVQVDIGWVWSGRLWGIVTPNEYSTEEPDWINNVKMAPTN